MTTFGALAPPGPPPDVSFLVASRPSMPGIRTSIKTTSGCSSAACASAAAPSAASPATAIPSALSRITQNPARTSSWSSTTSTRIAGLGAAFIAQAAWP